MNEQLFFAIGNTYVIVKYAVCILLVHAVPSALPDDRPLKAAALPLGKIS